MPSSPTYLPVHSLPANTNPTTSDYLVWQKAGSTGDVVLVSASVFLEKFADELIDPTTVTAFENNGWVAPT